MFGFEFANPKYFLLLILLVPMIVWYILKEKNRMLIYSFLHYRRLRGSNIPAGSGGGMFCSYWNCLPLSYW